MEILMLVPPPNVEGPIPKIAASLTDAFIRGGCSVALEAWGKHHEHETIIEKVIGRLRDIIHVRHILTKRFYNVIVVHTSHSWKTISRDIPLLLLIRNVCPHIILEFHGSSSNTLVEPGSYFFKFFSHCLVRLCDAILVLSTEEQKEWEKFYPKGQFYVVNNPFRTEEVESKRFVRRANKERPLVLLFVGRLIQEKGIFNLLDAILILSKKIPCQLLVVGDGKDAKSLEGKINLLGLTNNAILAGYLNGKDLYDVYIKSDVFVLPTLKEGFPTVIAEAMGFGLPIVTTSIRGAQDHLQEGVNCLFVPPDDPEALVSAIITLESDPELRMRMSKANLEKVKEFAPDIVIQRYLAILRQLTDGSS